MFIIWNQTFSILACGGDSPKSSIYSLMRDTKWKLKLCDLAFHESKGILLHEQSFPMNVLFRLTHTVRYFFIVFIAFPQLWIFRYFFHKWIEGVIIYSKWTYFLNMNNSIRSYNYFGGWSHFFLKLDFTISGKVINIFITFEIKVKIENLYLFWKE